MKLRTICAIALGLATLSASAAMAQSEAELIAAFKGEWQSFDELHSAEGKACKITLSGDGADGRYNASTESCKLELAEVSGWRIQDGQMVLLVGDNPFANLGGNQMRMSGTTAIGAPVVLDRVGENALVDRVAAARKSSGCYYLGFTDTCADDKQVEKPVVPTDGSGLKINVLVNLNARVEARDDARVLGVVPANSCIVADVCVKAADGVWCRAPFGEQSGWLKKVALRQERWPVITFANQCSQ